ncbi:MAG TPA: carboxypeptidase regulatory-like domain-containing protein [Paludibaculum sp.]
MTARSLLLSTLVTLLHGWMCAQTINLQVSAIPSTATRVVAVVDQGGLAAPIRFSKDVTAGALTCTMSMAVPAGGPYRVRAIAFTAGLAYPAILRSGKSAGLYVPNLTAVSAQIALAGLNAALEVSTPLSAPAGSTVTLAASVADPGDSGAGASGARVYSLTSALAGNQLGDERVGPLERLSEGVYRLSAAMATPPVGTTLSYQFAYNAWDFNDANNVEQPYWFWPNLSAGGVPLTLASQGSSSISVTISNLPAAGRRIVAVVDGTALQRPVRVVKDYAAGQTSSTLTAEVPAGAGYRVRVVAFTPGSVMPAILRTGKAIGLAAPGTAAVTLADPAFTLSSGTPASAPAGSTVSLEASLADPGDVAAGMPVASVHSRTAAFTANLDGTEWRGFLEGLGGGVYRLSAPVALPASAATTYYQFATNAYEFNDPSGRESPQLCWPNVQAGQALRQIASTLTSSIRITFTGTPASATRLIAVVDQGGLTKPVRAAASFTAGLPPASITVGVPPGGPFRVRLIALKSGLSTPTILRSGKAAGVTVAASTTAAAAVTLADYTATLDAATPVAGTAGGIVTVIVNVTDPGETASGAGATRLYGASSPFAQNLSVAPIIGLLEKSPDVTMKLSNPVVLPGGGGVFYYQVAYEAADFSDADGVERPHFCWPNLEAAQALKQITANANPSLYTLSGKVTLNGAALSGVTVSLSGTRTGSVVTGADGAYSFAFLPAGSYAVSAVRSNFTISPAASAVTLAGNQTVNFTAVQIAGSIDVTVSGLPAAGNRIVAVVDGGALAVPLRVAQGYVAGQTSAVVNVDVPAVGGYRIRVVAFAGGGGRPAILRAGQVSGVAAPSSTAVALADPTFTPLAGTPVSAAAGSTVSLEMTIGDPGNAVTGVVVGSVYGQAQPFTANLSGAEAPGVLQSTGAGSYRITVPLVLPGTAVTTYYQFATNAFDFNEPSGTESPYYVWPDVQAGQALRQIAGTLPTAIRILVSGVPASATRLIAVVDQGALAQAVRTVVSFAAGQAPGSVTVGAPIGSGYRVRVIAIRAGAATPSILRSGKAVGVSVAANVTTDAAVPLADYAVTLDPATPSSAPAGTTVNVIANLIDPGDTAFGAINPTLYGATTAATQNLAAAPMAGQLTDSGNGAWALTSPVVLPGASGLILYYQVAYEAADFSDASGAERPYFCWPNLEAAQVLRQIVVDPVFTISGKVTLSGAPLAKVTVSLSGLRTGSVVTASDGAYAFAGLPAGVYTVAAARTNFTFAPASSALTLAGNRTVNFSVAQVTGTVGVSRSVLRFGATLGGAAATTTQEIVVDISDNLPVSWTVVPDKAWLRVTPATGTGSGTFSVSLNQAALPTSGIWPGTLTLSTNTSTSAKVVIQVYLAVSPATGVPFGAFETPAGGTAVLSSSVPVTGWALDDVGVKKVQVWREPVGREGVYPNGLVYIGDAIFVPDARPDVASLFGDKPNNYRAGWGYLMLTNFLPNPTGGPAGNGTYKLHAIAVDEEGKQTELGIKTITVNNAKATKPFGTIDAPGPGEVVSGASYGVTGWALTPQPYRVDESGKDIWIAIDGVWLANVNYNSFRSDIATLFPSYANANGSAGNYSLDTTKLANGMHSIAWAVTDVAGRADGIGSRFFFVRNAVVATQAPPTLAGTATAEALERTAPERSAVAARAALVLPPGAAEGGDIEIEELGHVVMQLPRGSPWRGRMVHNEDRVPLPVGSTLESETGVFVWQVGPGFLGQYLLEFDNGVETRTVRVIVRPMGSTGHLTKEGQVGF